MSSRIETLKGLIAQDPANTRIRYMLAMETANSGDLSGAATVFEELLAVDANYVAAYLHGGQTLEKLGRIEDARALYRQGVDVARASRDDHARSELQSALDMLGG